MRRLSLILPPADLLQRVDRVEPTLKANRALGAVGWTAAVLSAGQLLLVVFTSQWWKGVSQINLSSWQRWGLISSISLLVVSFVFINWMRMWVRSSRQPFRYTFFVGPFEPIEGTEPAERAAWLPEDLAERLSGRIGRLSLLDPRYSKDAVVGEAHIHVGGTYGTRDDRIEVFPWVRLGPENEPATLAHPIRFSVKEEGVDADAYEKLVEWIYFSIASHVYARIREDVERKIALLPKRYFRAAAYFYEAEDYLRSHTLAAYSDAQKLYAEAMKLYDADWREPAESRIRRLTGWITKWRHVWSLFWRRKLCAVWPRLGRTELMVARAEGGYARALLDRRALAGLSGRQLNPVFEAKPVAERAVERLTNLRRSVPGRDEALFDARVTLAGALVGVGSPSLAEDELDRALREHPRRAQTNARYLYARGRVVTQQAQQFFRRAVELDPNLEVAQFHVALAADGFWRRRGSLDKSVVSMVIDEYERVLRLNPAHVAAWANQGYLYWLIEDRPQARRVLERGREFKEMQRETFVAQLDQTLTRIAAEEGRFADGYRSYMSAVNANFAEGISHAPDGYTAADFEGMTEAMVARFAAYRDIATAEWEAARSDDGEHRRRVADSVLAFVLNDYAEACMNYALRSGDPKYLDGARATLLRARDLNPRYPMSSYNLQRLDRWTWEAFDPPDPVDLDEDELARYDEGELFARLPAETDHLERVLRYEPRWPDGVMALAFAYSQQALSERKFSKRLNDAVKACTVAACELRIREGPRVAADLFDLGVTAERRPEVRRLVHEPVDRKPREQGRRPVAVDLPVRPTSQVGKDPRERARTLLQAGRRMRDRAHELLASARDHEQKAERFVRQLLPHEWLWSTDGNELELSLFARADFAQRREWERRLDDLHARALVVWCLLRLERARREEAEEAEGSRRRFGRLRPSRDDAKRIRSVDILPALELCLRHFWPDDIYLLSSIASTDWLDEARRGSCADALTRATKHLFERDPVYWNLWYLDDDTPGLVEVLRSAAEQRGIPPYLYVWLGWRLDRLKRPDLALIAYGNARESKDPELLIGLAEKLAEGGHWEERRRALRRAMAAERCKDSKRLRPEDFYRREIGRSLWFLGRLEEAVASFTKVSGEDEDEAWRTALVGDVADGEQPSKDTYRLLKRWLGHDLTRAQVHSRRAMRRDTAAALLLLTRSCYQELIHRRRDLTHRMFDAPAATPPIIVEADAELFPSGRDSRVATRLVDEELPAMRAELEQDTGVEIPVTWIRPVSGLGEGRYRLYLNDVVLVDEQLTEEQSDRVAATSAIVARLRELILANLDELLTTDAVERMLDRWVEADPGTGSRMWILATRLDDERLRARFVRLLRALVAERIPLTDLDPVVRAFVEAPEADTVVLAERTRGLLGVAERVVDLSEVADALPPEVEEELERWIHEDGDRKVLALPPDVEARLKAAVEQALAGNDRAALVVLRPGLRPFVRRLVAQVDPSRDVLARAELRDVVLLAGETTPLRVDRGVTS